MANIIYLFDICILRNGFGSSQVIIRTCTCLHRCYVRYLIIRVLLNVIVRVPNIDFPPTDSLESTSLWTKALSLLHCWFWCVWWLEYVCMDTGEKVQDYFLRSFPLKIHNYTHISSHWKSGLSRLLQIITDTITVSKSTSSFPFGRKCPS